MDTEKRSLDLKSSSGTQFPKLVAREALEKEPPVASISVNKPNYKNPPLPLPHLAQLSYLISLIQAFSQTPSQETFLFLQYGPTATAIQRRPAEALGLLGLRNSSPYIVRRPN